MLRIAALLAVVLAVTVFWQPLSAWTQSLLCATFALLCWHLEGKGGKHGQ